MPEAATKKALSNLSSREQEVLIAFLSNLKSGHVEVDYDGLATTLSLDTRTAAHDAWAEVQKKLFGDKKPSLVLGPLGPLGPRSIAKSKALIQKTCDSFTSPTVVLVFWMGKYKITLHRDMLLDSPYFKEKFGHLPLDPKEQLRFDFPRYLKSAGEQLVRWLHYEELLYDIDEVVHLRGHDAGQARLRIIHAYLLAMHLEMEEWANRLTDLYSAFFLEEIPLVMVYYQLRTYEEYSLNVDSMNRLIMAMAAVLIRRHGLQAGTYEAINGLAKQLEEGGSFVLELVGQMRVVGERSLEETRAEDKCAWHTHVRTKKCT